MIPKARLRAQRPQTVLYGGLGIALVIVIVGSMVAVSQTGITWATIQHDTEQFVVRLGGANLIAQVDRTILPADGKSQSVIQITPLHTSNPITVNILKGGGQIEQQTTPTGEATNTIRFTYIAAGEPGDVIIRFRSGALEQLVAIKLVQAVAPTPPAITSPPDKTLVSSGQPEVIGTGPVSTKIIVTDNGETNTTTQTDERGNFQTHLEKPLYNGQHTLGATAVSPLGMLSPTSNLVTITVKTDPVQLDQVNIRITPKKVVAGSSFGLFVPASLNAAKVVVEIAGGSYQLFDYNKSSIFSAALPAPDQPGTYLGDLIVTDNSGNSTRFAKVVNLVVVSSF
ncbi:MAG: hypothetical protein V1826_03195 [bacterium]